MEPVRFSIQSSLGGKPVTMSSTLVETVSINYEDFSESFLTCSTCLCTYDGSEHTPKLLPCSHTVCLLCLTRIVQATQTRGSERRDTAWSEGDGPSTFRCPICRESINVPRGGVAALPPSFLVNQLLDLMARQRREVVPKCGVHPSQELLFCESCDCVFCVRCTSGSHGTTSVSSVSSGHIDGIGQTTDVNSTSLTDHTVVPFSIAIKRMSEILLYKANEVASKLSSAEEVVSLELARLEQSEQSALSIVAEAYARIELLIEKAKQNAFKSVSQVSAAKSQVLRQQLDLIRNEKSLVERDVTGLQYQVEVRSLSDRIAALQEKLEAVSALQEPRENSFLVYVLEPLTSIEEEIERLVSGLGRPKSSTALPSLSTLGLDPSTSLGNSTVATHHALSGRIEMIDYHGLPRREGGDPVQVTVEPPLSDGNDTAVPPVSVPVIDDGDGTYRFWFRPSRPGAHMIRASLFGRPLKHSPLNVQAVDRQEPISFSTGSKGSGPNQLVQPSGVVALIDPTNQSDSSPIRWTVYVLDSGNQRIAKYSPDFQLIGYLNSPALEGRSATGMCLSSSGPSGQSLWIANWKTRSVSEISVEDGRPLRSVTFPSLQEPVDVAVTAQGNILIADAQQAAVFVVSVASNEPKVVCRCGSAGAEPGQFQQHTLRSVTCDSRGQIIAADANRLQVFCGTSGRYLRTLSPALTKGQWGGVTYDGQGFLLASYNESAKIKTSSGAAGSKCGVWIIRLSTGAPLFHFEANPAKLKRPGRLCTVAVDQESALESRTRTKETERTEASVNDRESAQLEAHRAAYLYICDVADDCLKRYRYL